MMARIYDDAGEEGSFHEYVVIDPAYDQLNLSRVNHYHPMLIQRPIGGKAPYQAMRNHIRKLKYMKRLIGPRGLCLIVSVILLAALTSLGWMLHSIFTPTIIPTSNPTLHIHENLPLSEETRRKEYVNNTFIQMLHQHQLVVNTTECWVCGLIPASASHPTPFLPYPFTKNGSKYAWFITLKTAYDQRNATNPPMTQFSRDLQKEFNGTNSTGTMEERTAYRQRNSTRLYHYFRGDKPRFIKIAVVAHPAPFCINGQGTIPVGISNCAVTMVLNDTNPPAIVASQGTCFICGINAYVWLTGNWSGQCYIGFLLPPTFTANGDFHKPYVRIRRGVISNDDTAGQEFTDFIKGYLPFWGPMVNSRHIRQLTRVVEATINTTAGALSNITAELQADRLVTLQNRMVLDIILADRGGVCKMVGSSCYVYIPDNAPTVYQAIQKLHNLAVAIHQEEGSWSLTQWFWNIVTTWGWKIVIVIALGATLLLSCCLCIQCAPALCGLCITCLTPKPANRQQREERVMMQQEIHNLMNMDIGNLYEPP